VTGATGLLGCSLQTATQVLCQQNVHCRAAFGPGAVCDADGTCRFVPKNEHCQINQPADLVSAPASYVGWQIVGGFFDLSQPAQQAMANSLQLAVHEYGVARGGEDPEVGVVICTTNGEGEIAAEVTAYLTTDLGAAVVVGGAGEHEVSAAFDSTTAAGALLISPAATSSDLWFIDTSAPSDAVPGLLWRTVPPDAAQAIALVVDLMSPGVGRGLPVENLGILYENTPFGRGLAREVNTRVLANSGATKLETYEPKDTGSMTTAVAALAAYGTLEETLLVASTVADVTSFATLWQASSVLRERHLLLPHASANIATISAIPEPQRDRVRGTRLPRPATSAYETFAAAYAAAYPGQTSADDLFRGSFAYDAGWLAIYGLAWAYLQDLDATGERAAQGLRNTSTGIELQLGPSSWSDLKNRFAAGLPVDLAGASGALDFDPSTEELPGRFEIWQVGVCEEVCITRLYDWPP
jgi:branched-chain amino acid transport system substrate-binding protein